MNSMNKEMLAKLAQIGQRMSAKTQTIEVAESDAEETGKQMVCWPEDAAAMPTELTRVSLFGLPADKPGARKLLDDVKLDSRNDVEVFYTGKQLSAKDETVWLACLRMGRGIPMGQRIYLNKIGLLKEVRLTNTGPNWSMIAARLDRLSKAHFKVNFKRGDKTYSITTGMLKWGIEHETGDIYIRLDPDGASLFENLSYQPWDVRLSLQSDVAARMLSYISGHENGKPHSQTIDTLKRWCGYGGRVDKFRTACIAALEELETKRVIVKGSTKIISGARGDVVCWVRERTNKQPTIEAKP